MLRIITILGCLFLSGCSILPEIYHQPQIHNPFPQLTRVAIVPFFNLSAEPTMDGRKVAMAYQNELQSIPGFEVVPVGVVETAMVAQQIQLEGPKGTEEARRLAQALHVDAVVIGAITDYTPYYPPRFGLEVQWYSANPGFHPIPPGYGLPWGTVDEKDIPGPLVFEAEMALAKEQLKTQTPAPPVMPVPEVPRNRSTNPESSSAPGDAKNTSPSGGMQKDENVQPAEYQASVDATVTGGKDSATESSLPANWPDPKGFIPRGPQSSPPPYRPSKGPVLRHIRVYNGNDMEFTTALSEYYKFRDEARFGGWQGYLQRSDDFLRFCCHLHISEMLTARGGAGEPKVVWRWPSIR